MQNTYAWYGGEQLTLWKLADLDEKNGMQQHCYLQFSSSGQELQSKLSKMANAIQDCEDKLFEVV